MQATFTNRDLAMFVHGHSAGKDQFDAVMSAVRSSPELVALGKDGRGEDRFTSRSMLETDQRLERATATLEARCNHGVADRHRELALERALDRGLDLSAEQRGALEHVTSGRGISNVIGYAGTGKSAMLGIAREAWKAAGYQVPGAALSGIAAEGLEHGSGIGSRTLASFEHQWANDRERLTEKHMRGAGRERTSDGVTFPNYPIDSPIRAADAPACKADNNVDTCWSRGVGAARRGDLRGALEHYNMSCDARIGTMGCYEAGKLYLHNRQLRDYARAKERLARTCSGEDSGQGPYACKYLGWMSFTGTGVPRNLDEAFGKLAKACFFHNDAILIDPEGCHFLGRTALELRGRSQRDAGRADHLAYIAFAQGCTDNAKTVCDEARALYRREAARAASWIKLCESDVGEHGAIGTCAELAKTGEDYDAAQDARRQLASMFRAVSTSSD